MMDEYDEDEYGGQHIEMKEVCAMNSKTTFSNRITIISSQTLRHILDTYWIHTGYILDTYCRHIQLVIFSVIIYYFVPLRFYAASTHPVIVVHYQIICQHLHHRPHPNRLVKPNSINCPHIPRKTFLPDYCTMIRLTTISFANWRFYLGHNSLTYSK